MSLHPFLFLSLSPAPCYAAFNVDRSIYLSLALSSLCVSYSTFKVDENK